MSDLYVARLVQYGIESGLIPEEERIYSTNQILEVMKTDDYEVEIFIYMVNGPIGNRLF